MSKTKTIEEQMLSLKESFDSVGTKFNGLTWQRIEKSHLEFSQSQTQGLQEQNAELVEMLKSLLKHNDITRYDRTMITELLVKHKQS